MPVSKQPEKPIRYKFKCIESLRSNCSASQKEYGRLFFQRWEKYGISKRTSIEPGGPIALSILPKDQHGLVNWSLAAIMRYIEPRDYIYEKKEKDEGSYKLNFIVFQAKVGIMADVLFPHALHTYWLSCNNCHPKIFKAEVGANPMSMTAIEKGEFCGRCHGKVAFPFGPDENCRRCHTLIKNL